MLPPPGSPYCGWLKRLKASIRNSAFIRSVIRKCFANDKSTVRVGGPRQSPTGAVPMVPNLNPFSVYLFGLIHWKLAKLGLRHGCPGTKLGRWAPAPLPIPDGSPTFEMPPMVGVRECPLVRTTIDSIAQEPRAVRTYLSMFCKVGRLESRLAEKMCGRLRGFSP